MCAKVAKRVTEMELTMLRCERCEGVIVVREFWVEAENVWREERVCLMCGRGI